MINKTDVVAANLKKRYRKEKIFTGFGILSVGFAALCLLFLLFISPLFLRSSIQA